MSLDYPPCADRLFLGNSSATKRYPRVRPALASGTPIARFTTMQLRIVVSLEGSRRVVKVEGRLDAEGVPELENVTRDVCAALCLDLSDLRLTDGEGIAALLRLQKAGAVIQGASPYLKLLLQEALYKPEMGIAP
jgi:hypothetical protein